MLIGWNILNGMKYYPYGMILGPSHLTILCGETISKGMFLTGKHCASVLEEPATSNFPWNLHAL
jgi:hypothetical protein